MAGIGFVLRKLIKKDDLMGIFQAYFYAAIVSSGPWLFTVAALGSFFLIFRAWHPIEQVENFRAVILYNFSFSLVFAAPFSIVATRHLADCIYQKKLEDAIGILFGSFIVLLGIGLPAITAFYLYFATMSTGELLMSILNFLILLCIWLLAIFISATKYYRIVTFSFIVGLVISVAASIYLGIIFSIAGMLAGFNIGLAVIVASLTALVLAEYPKPIKNLFRFLPYLRIYWKLALGGLFYNLGIWVDKWIMWFSPDAVTLPNGLTVFPYYDEAMFIAYLTIIPSMALFLLTQETAFFEVYVRFYESILNHASLKQISANHQAMLKSIAQSSRQIVFLQLLICILALFLAPEIFNLLGISFIQLGIFRFGILGSFFQILMLYMVIILSYFDYREGTLRIQLMFFATNAIFTLIAMQMGFPYYGYGYFLSTLISFVFAAVLFGRCIQNVPYHAFVTANPSVNKSGSILAIGE